MRKFGLALGLILVICTNLFSSTSVAAESDVEVLSESVIHVHTANSGSCYTPVYHIHNGSESSGGECFQTPVYHSHGDSCYTVCTSTRKVLVYNSHAEHMCLDCGGTQTNSGLAGMKGTAGEVCNHTVTNGLNHGVLDGHKKTLTCTKTENVSIDSYRLSCTKSTNAIESYELVCSKGGTSIGRVYMTKTNVGTYTLSVESEGVTIVSAVWGDGTTSTSFSPTSDGTYTCNVTVAEDNGTSYTKSLSYTVDDYDKEPPIFQSMNRYTERCTSCDIECNSSDNLSVSDFKLEKD